MALLGKDADSTAPGKVAGNHGVRSGIGMPEEEDDETSFDKAETSMFKGLFGVIYTVSRERHVTWKFMSFKILLDLWQLLTLIINPMYGWAIDGNAGWWKIISFIQLNDFMMARGLPFFTACLYIFVSLLVFTVLLCVWVAWSFKNQQFDYVWPITFLRYFGVIFFQMLDVASMALFFMALDCQYFSVNESLLGFSQEFPDQYCWTMPFMIHSAVSALSLIVFVTLAVAFQMGEMELNMVTRNLLGMAHTKAEVLSFLLKFLMTGATVFLNSLHWLSVFQLGGSVFLLYLALQWESYYHAWVNHARVGVYGALFYSALVMVFLVYAPQVDLTDLKAVDAHKQACTIVMVAGLVPAAGLAILASIMRLRYVEGIVNKFRDFKPGTVHSKLIHKFRDAREVELCARCCRKWVNEDTLVVESVELAFVILKAGMEQLPGDAFMIILYSSFLMDVKGGYQSGLSELPAARKADKSVYENFALFSREQMHTQKSSGAKGSQGADLVSYVEQQRSYRMALKVNKEAFLATSDFWTSLLKPHVDMRNLNKKVAFLDACVDEALITYRQLLLRSPDNWMLLRMYGVFLEMIRNDPWGAGKNFAEADRLMQDEEDAKQSAFMTESMSKTEEGQVGNSTGDVDPKAVIIINARCIIQNVNKVACDAMGYTQKELVGKNINMIVPRPFSDQHDQYVMKHVTTGKSTILDKTMETVVVHKDRYVMAVNVFTTKLSGFGMDSIFMGIFTTVPAPKDTARAWVLGSGVILSVDSTFSDWFGYRPEDLPGSYFSTLVKDTAKLETAFKNKREADALAAMLAAAALEPGGVVADIPDKIIVDMQMKHKFAGLIECKVVMAAGGGARGQHMMILNITRDDSESMMVSDGKGRLLHVSTGIAADLGFSVLDLLGELADNVWDVILPEPFSQLHQVHITQELPPFLPPYSCRSGLSVCLLASTDEGPKPRPYKIKVRTRRLDKTGETANIVMLQASTMEKAMDERRLSVMLDQEGRVTKVGGSPSALFGFDPEDMVGKPMSTFVDVFQTKEGTSEAMAARSFQDMLVNLAIRSLEAPGESFRVGVTSPILDNIGGGALSGAIASHLHSKATSPAIMQVIVHFPEHKTCQSADKGPVMDKKPGVVVVKSQPEISPEESLSDLMANDDVPPRRMSTKDSFQEILVQPQRATKEPAAGKEGKEGLNFGAGLVLEIKLWRADIMSGMLHLDRSGRVTRTSDLPMYQPGLLMGTSDASFVGRHISAILPVMAGLEVSDMFLPDLGRGIKALIKGRKGGMKQETGKPMKEFEAGKPGAVSLITTKHLTDGQVLDISVQAVNVKRFKRETCLVIHLFNPCTGPQDFKEILMDNPPKCHALIASEELLDSQVPHPPALPGYGGPATALNPDAARQPLSSFKRGNVNRRRLSYDDSVNMPREDRSFARPVTIGRLSLDELVQELKDDNEAPYETKGSGGDGVSDDDEKAAEAPIRQGRQRASSWVLSGGKPNAGQHALPAALPRSSVGEDSVVGDNPAGLGYSDSARLLPIDEHVPDRLDANAVSTFDGKEAFARDPDASSHQSSEDQAMTTQKVTGQEDGDMRRGQRYKKVARIMTHDFMMRDSRMFKYQAYGAIVFVVAVSIACFMAMFLPLTTQATGVTTLDTIGRMGVSIGEVFVAVESLDILFSGLGTPGLQGLTSTDDIGRILDRLEITNNLLQADMTNSYFAVMKMSEVSGLDVIWKEPSLNVSIFNDQEAGVNPKLSFRNYSMWDAGRLYLAAAKNVWQNAHAHNSTVAGTNEWRDWSFVLYITTNMIGIYNFVFATMDLVVEEVIITANNVNNIQLVLMVVEGVVCSTLATIFIFFINAKVTKTQFHLFGPFILLPTTVIRGMCKIDMDSVIADVQTDAAATVKVSGRRASMTSDAGHGTPWEKLLQALRPLAFWKARIVPVGGVYAPRRTLVTSPKTALAMSLPFACWGLIMIAINAAGQAKLSEINSSIALFSVVNNVHMKYFRNFGLVMDMTLTSDEILKDSRRNKILENFLFPREYNSMLFGEKTPAVNGSLKSSVRKGITEAGSEGIEILYNTKKCLRENVSSCITENETLYQYTVNGLDMAVQAHIGKVTSMLYMNASNPTLESAEFNLVWNIRPDIIGGLTQLNHVYFKFVQSVYMSVITIHTVGLVLSLLLMAIFYFLMLRPYLNELSKSRRRIAYLLSQLPNEIDVVAMVKKSVANTVGDSGMFTGQSNAGSMASSMASSMGSEISFG